MVTWGWKLPIGKSAGLIFKIHYEKTHWLFSLFPKNSKLALAGMAQLVEASSCRPRGHRSWKWKVTGWIPGQSTCLGCRFGPPVRAHTRGNRSVFLFHIKVSLSHSLPPFPSLWKYIKSLNSWYNICPTQEIELVEKAVISLLTAENQINTDSLNFQLIKHTKSLG